MCNDITVAYAMKRKDQVEKGNKPVSLKDLHHRFMSDTENDFDFNKVFNGDIRDTKPTEE